MLRPVLASPDNEVGSFNEATLFDISEDVSNVIGSVHAAQPKYSFLEAGGISY